MHQYFIKTPWWIKKIFSSYIWHIPVENKTVYLTFDDGPHPVATPFVLQQLKEYNAAATFFCIGKNVVNHPDIYHQIIAGGHAVGNHTHNHLNGWKTATDAYIENISEAAKHIDTHLFRPPYGRIKRSQAKQIAKALQRSNAQIIMWDVLSADFDTTITPQQCVNNVLKHVTGGSVVVFHDSEKAFKNLAYALPVVLQELKKQGYIFKRIEV